nr:MAG TPA: hypothetical protein [Caudoviricetes sp.]
MHPDNGHSFHLYITIFWNRCQNEHSFPDSCYFCTLFQKMEV